MAVSSGLSGLRVLITNDDGVHSSALKVLERIANSITPDVWTVAPEVGQSGKGLAVTFDSVLRIHELSPRRFSVNGTPADCVFIALGEILKDRRPDLILSGINYGANVADFIGLSGTVGATFAAASQHIKAIAISQHFTENPPAKFSAVEHYLPQIIKRLLSFDWGDGVCMNVNFPEAPIGEIGGIRVAKQGELDITWQVFKKEDPVSKPYYWLKARYEDKNKIEDSDVQLLEQGKMITITPLQCRHEYAKCEDELKGLFSANV